MERWKQVNDGYYISNKGRMMVTKNKNGKGISDKCKRISNPIIKSNGYSEYYIGDGKFKLAHRLVAENFIDNPLNLPQVNHKNFIKTDNRVDNLEWVSVEDNNKHRYDNGRANQYTLYGQKNKPNNQ